MTEAKAVCGSLKSKHQGELGGITLYEFEHTSDLLHHRDHCCSSLVQYHCCVCVCQPILQISSKVIAHRASVGNRVETQHHVAHGRNTMVVSHSQILKICGPRGREAPWSASRARL